MSKICKSLDLNKLFNEQAKGKLLKKHMLFPMFGSIKYDGNYVCIQVQGKNRTFNTSGGLTYTHTDSAGDIFDGVYDGAYFAERIAGEGKLGDRDRCNLRGSKSDQTSTGHSYRVFDYVSIEDYIRGYSEMPFLARKKLLAESGLPIENIARQLIFSNQDNLDNYMKDMVRQGWEGMMLVSPAHEWKDTKSRTVDLVKYKLRPTVDLLCVGTTEGEGKYEGMVGALVLQDSNFRTVSVGSGLSDMARSLGDEHIGRVYEVEYERIADTYIQPTLIRHREDKDATEID